MLSLKIIGIMYPDSPRHEGIVVIQHLTGGIRMQAMEQAAKRPFHETIVDAIGRAERGEELTLLYPIIKETKIPKNHDAIIAAWEKSLKEAWWGKEDIPKYDLTDLPADLLKQKQEAAEKEKAKAEAKEKEQAGATSS